MDVFLWAMLLTKWLTNFSHKSLKVQMDLGGNEENQDLAAFFKVVGKSLHRMASPAPWMDMLVRNISRWSMGSALSLHTFMVGSLKPSSGMALLISWVNGELPNISKLTYSPLIVTCFSIASILAYMSAHFLSIFVISFCLVNLFLRLTSPLPSFS